MKKCITALTLLVGLFLCLNAWAITKTGNVYASGNMVYGQATLAMNGEMPGTSHTLTIWGKLTSPTGRTTGWVQQIRYGNQANYFSVPLGLLEDYGSWRFDVSYGIFCPIGRLTSTTTQSWFFSYGHSTGCLFIMPGTQQVINYQGTKMWYALYNYAVGCGGNCKVSTPYGARSPYVGPAAPAYVNIKYTWVYVNYLNQTYCLEAYDEGRHQCSSGQCGDGTGL